MLLFVHAMSLVAWQRSDSAGSKSGNASKKPVQEIELPAYPPDLPAAPNQQLFEQRCLLCHSARYVTMQPGFSQVVWEKEVKKMVDVYGAAITASEQQEIIEYLVAIRGPKKEK
jgi:hypothetical protein